MDGVDGGVGELRGAGDGDAEKWWDGSRTQLSRAAVAVGDKQLKSVSPRVSWANAKLESTVVVGPKERDSTTVGRGLVRR